MTDDELDLLASAYVDGEATPEEVALVERDPELQARVEAFRAVRVDDAITPPSGLRDRHLTAAMAEFDVVVAGADGGEAVTAAAVTGEHDTAPVVDLRAAAARRAERDATAPSTNGSRRPARPARKMPSWLPAAAGFVIIGGGLVWAVGQTGGDGDDADTDATEVAASFETEDAGDDDAATSDDSAEESAEAEMAMDEEAMEESADDTADGEAGATRSEADAASAAPADGDSDESAEDAEADFAVPEPLVFLDAVPDAVTLYQLDDLPEPEPDLELSLCGAEVVASTLGEPIGFIPVDILGDAAELFLFADGDGTEIRVLVDDNCQPLEP